MSARQRIYELAAEHRLDEAAVQWLWGRTGVGHEPAGLAARLPLALALVAAALGGLGLVMWVAANWDTWGRFAKLGLLQGLVASAWLGAWWMPRARAPLGLLGWLGLGGLLAYVGQTYQAGADPWQLFAAWALLGLPLCLAARSDVLWAPWAVVATLALTLWVRTRTGHAWRVADEDLGVYLSSWLALGLLAVAMGPGARFTGAGAWAWRTVVTLAAITITWPALWAVFSRPTGGLYGCGLATLAVSAVLLARQRQVDVFALSAVALGLNVLLMGGLAWRLLSDARAADMVGALFILGLLAAVLLAGSVKLILRVVRKAPAQEVQP